MQVWSDLPKRALSALILGPVALLCVWLGSYWWTALMAVCVAGLAWEWVRLCGGSTRRLPGLMVPGTVLVACAAAVQNQTALAFAIMLAGIGVTTGIALSSGRQRRLGWYIFGLAYIGLAGIALIELRHHDVAGRLNVLFLLAIVWASDVSAYSFGRFIGGAKLAPAISPNKTWSGAAGGAVGAALVGLAFAITDAGPAHLGKAILVAVTLGIATQCGDLFESWVKRYFGVKDSSRLIPGHGGLLDRLDGVLLAAPVAALLGYMSGPGIPLWR